MNGRPPAPASRGKTSRGEGLPERLSLEALQYGHALHLNDVTALAARLYHYNRLPLSPRWRQRLPTSVAVADFLGVRGAGQLGQSLDRHWIKGSDGQWTRWRSRDAPLGVDRRYKLYVSPRPEHLPETFACVVGVFTEQQVPAFKVGNTVGNLLRPDKLVGYFESGTHRRSVAVRLREELPPATAHGVPFTASDRPDGLLSWGVDPPVDVGAPAGRAASWRSWMTGQLATSLVKAELNSSCEEPPWRLALRELVDVGIDITTWEPFDDGQFGSVAP